MEPIEYLKKEKTQLSRLKKMRESIYSPVARMKAEVHTSAEPIDVSKKEGLGYRPIRRGGSWAGVYGCAWFHITGGVPAQAAGKHVVAHINIGGEGLIFAPGCAEPMTAITQDTSYIDKVQSGVAKTIVEISPEAAGGEVAEYYIDAGFNGYYNIPAGCALFRFADICTVDDSLLSLYYDYLTAASLLSCQKEETERAELSRVLDLAFSAWERGDMAGAKSALAPLFAGQPDRSLEFTAIGHSHLDLAWLWPLRETKRKASRTFQHQLYNLSRYPQYIYGVSQPQQLQFVREKFPQEYEKLRALAKSGRIECQGGMWVEADTNLSSGEALVRQIYYGKQFFREEMGQEMKICWLPDVFGYNGNLPQIMKKSGLPYFMTIKLSWNEHNRFPYRSFVWSGIDGSEVLVHMAPADTYNSAGCPACAAFARDNYTEKELCPRALMIFGIGDGGGGPGEAHIEMLTRQSSLAGSPKVKFGRAVDFFDSIDACRSVLPRYSGELYLEKHQGTYTTQGRNKRYNRLAEYALADLEALCALRWVRGGEYPQADIDRWWKEVLLYQFHDIIPGSSITRVYEESRARYSEILGEIEKKKAETAAGLSGGAGQTAFNPTSFARSVRIMKDGKAYTAELPAWGFAPLAEAPAAAELSCGNDRIENSRLCAVFAPSGEVVSLKDKADGTEYAAGPLGRLTLYRDKWLYYNAWDIDWKYFEKPKETLRAYKTESFCDGEAAVFRSFYRHGRTRITQEARLAAGSGALEFRTECDWHETFRMLRADFLPAVFSDKVKCDIQFGSIMRSTHDETPQEKAQFEICAHKYVDVSDSLRGLSLLNNCKYGHRVKDGLISLNLLRSPIFPDKKADRGHHVFSYSLFPHAGGCGVDTLREAYFLNKPVELLEGSLPAMSIAGTTDENVVVETIKKAYSGEGIIVRLYESSGAARSCGVRSSLDFGEVRLCDLMENDIAEADPDSLSFEPFEIKTLRIIFKEKRWSVVK